MKKTDPLKPYEEAAIGARQALAKLEEHFARVKNFVHGKDLDKWIDDLGQARHAVASAERKLIAARRGEFK